MMANFLNGGPDRQTDALEYESLTQRYAVSEM